MFTFVLASMQVFISLRNGALHIPYRNSKLTHLLQPCIGGDSKVRGQSTKTRVKVQSYGSKYQIKSRHDAGMHVRQHKSVGLQHGGNHQLPGVRCQHETSGAGKGHQEHHQAALTDHTHKPKNKKMYFVSWQQHPPTIINASSLIKAHPVFQPQMVQLVTCPS